MAQKLDLKKWERDYRRKRILLISSICLGVCALAIVLLIVVRNTLKKSDAQDMQNTLGVVVSPNQYWDECSGQYYRLLSQQGEDVQLSKHMTLRTYSVLLDNGEKAEQDMIVGTTGRGQWIQDITSIRYYKGSKLVQSIDIQDDKEITTYKDCVYVYCMGVSTEEFVVCVVTQDSEVEDSKHSEMVQTYKDGFWYTYIPLSDKDIDGYRLIADGYDCTNTGFSEMRSMTHEEYFEATVPLRGNQ